MLSDIFSSSSPSSKLSELSQDKLPFPWVALIFLCIGYVPTGFIFGPNIVAWTWALALILALALSFPWAWAWPWALTLAGILALAFAGVGAWTLFLALAFAGALAFTLVFDVNFARAQEDGLMYKLSMFLFLVGPLLGRIGKGYASSAWLGISLLVCIQHLTIARNMMSASKALRAYNQAWEIFIILGFFSALGLALGLGFNT